MSYDTIPPARAASVRSAARRRRGLIVIAFLVLAALVLTGAAVVAYSGLAARIKTVDIGAEAPHKGQPFAPYEGGFNVLLAGSDTRAGQGISDGTADAGARNDVTLLLHVAKDHRTASVVSFPRDMVVTLPACTDPSTGAALPAAAGRQINEALGRGGLGCVAKTVEQLSGTSIPFAAEVSFDGVTKMSDAVGGVPVCFTAPVTDAYSGLSVPKAGLVPLQGGQALAFLRSRHGVGDGSDLARISTQQVFLSALVRTLKSDATLSDPAKVYSIAQAALENMTFSKDMGDLGTLASLGRALADVPLDAVSFVTYPYTVEGNRVTPHSKAAAVLKEALASDRILDESSMVLGRGSKAGANEPSSGSSESSGGGGAGGSTATPTPGGSTPMPGRSFIFEGQNADDSTCVIGAK